MTLLEPDAPEGLQGPPVPVLETERLILRALFKQAHLRDGDLAQRTVRGEGDEVRVRGEQQRIFISLLGSPFFTVSDELKIRFAAEVVLLDAGAIV